MVSSFIFSVYFTKLCPYCEHLIPLYLCLYFITSTKIMILLSITLLSTLRTDSRQVIHTVPAFLHIFTGRRSQISAFFTVHTVLYGAIPVKCRLFTGNILKNIFPDLCHMQIVFQIQPFFFLIKSNPHRTDLFRCHADKILTLYFSVCADCSCLSGNFNPVYCRFLCKCLRLCHVIYQ